MTPEELSVFGVDQTEADEIGVWIRRHMASIVGAKGRGGSGVFVRLKDGRLAILTARHVVISCILTGEITVSRVKQDGSHSVEPISISIDNRTDSALLIVDDNLLPGDALPFEEWTSNFIEVTKGMPVISSGVVGEWKEINASLREIRLTKVLSYWTGVVEPINTKGLIACDVEEMNTEIPNSFGGMSGGPLFSINKKLAGINTAEERHVGGSNRGRLIITPVRDLDGLYAPYRSPSDAPLDYIHQAAALLFLAVDAEDKNKTIIRILVGVDFFWSLATPDALDGQIGRISSIVFFSNPGSEKYRINLDVVFRWWDENTDDSRLTAFQMELFFFLSRIGLESVREASVE